MKIEELVRTDEESAPDKQRHTGQRIFERLHDEFGYKGGSTHVRAFWWKEGGKVGFASVGVWVAQVSLLPLNG